MSKILLALWIAGSLVVGAWAGLKLPDFDQRLDFLLHRSIVTHGPLVPLVTFLLLRNVRSLAVRIFPMFLCLGFMVHLAFDLFPRAWVGYALISIPGYGWTPPIVSVVWIAASMVLCAYWAIRLVRTLPESALLLLGTLGIFAYAALNEVSLFGPLVATLGSLAICAGASLFVGTAREA